MWGHQTEVSVLSKMSQVKEPILTIDGLIRPWGVALNQRGEVVVTEWDGHCISVFNTGGEKLRSFGSFGSGEGEFKYPSGVALDGEGSIIVADNVNHCIKKLTQEGQFIELACTEEGKPFQSDFPRGVTYNTTCEKVYMISDSQGAQILNADLSFSSSFGSKGSDKGELDNAHDISCDSTGNVYITDTTNHRIQVFTAEGRFLRMFGRSGDGRGELYFPICISIDSSDRVYVSDNNHRVSVFTSEGQFITSFGRKGKGPGETTHPRGLAVDASGMVYLCDSNNHRIQVFHSY